MAKFVARVFIPGDSNIVELATCAYAWEAWGALEEHRYEMEAKAAGVPVEKYEGASDSVWADMYELSLPEAYDDDDIFGVSSLGDDWLYSKGTGTMWGRVPGMEVVNTGDLGLCYQVIYTDLHGSL